MLLIGNGLVLTFDDDFRVIEDGGVLLEGENIITVGKTTELLKQYPGVNYKNVQGKIIMPGLINTHMHLYSTFARGMDLKTEKPPQNFREILEKIWWRLDDNLREDDIYYSALYAVIDCIMKGTTTIFDHHASFGFIDGTLDILAEVVQKIGIRANLSLEISDRNGPEKASACIRENERFINKLKSTEESYLGGSIGLHASFTLEDETLKKVKDLKDRVNKPFHLHLAEGREDFEDSKKRGYQGVVDRLNSFGIIDPDTLAVHGVYMQEEELNIFKESGSYLIHNPESNMNNAVGFAPVNKLIKEGVTVGLGTDGYTTDMFESIKVANLLQKYAHRDPRVGEKEVFAMAFLNNRQIAKKFFHEELGVIKPGAVADLIVINYNSPTPVNKQNFFYHLLFGLNGGMVETTIIGGKILMEEREVQNLDYERICRKTKEQAVDFWRRF